VGGTDCNEDSNEENPIDRENHIDRVNHDGSYHGYGIIGGIMILNINKMNQENWLKLVINELIVYRNKNNNNNNNNNNNSIKWNAKLNDQDIFNAIIINIPHIGIYLCIYLSNSIYASNSIYYSIIIVKFVL
jgi:hypothetical protein